MSATPAHHEEPCAFFEDARLPIEHAAGEAAKIFGKLLNSVASECQNDGVVKIEDSPPLAAAKFNIPYCFEKPDARTPLIKK